MNHLFRHAVFVLVLGASSTAAAQGTHFTFRDVGNEAGLFPHVGKIAGHAAAWGDVDADGWPDLYVGTFAQADSKPNMLFRSTEGGKYRLDKQEVLAVSGRASGSVFADFDNDGDLDLYLANLGGGKSGYAATDSRLFRNDGKGNFEDISQASGACPTGFRGRSACVLDYNGDGRLDLLLGEGVYYGSPRRSRLLANLGGLKFKDVTKEAGLPETPGLGVAAADVNGDTWPDVFLAARDGGNRLLLNDGAGRFREPPGNEETFAWKYETGDDTTCGVAFGDVNRDGRLDLLVGQHYKRPWLDGVPVRLYVNRGNKNRSPQWENVTDSAGLVPLPMKGPHAEIQDFDNDGWPDIYVSIVKFAKGQPHPVIFQNQGGQNGKVRFKIDALGVNDFPTDEDRQATNVGPFFDRMIREKKIIYMAPGPTCDFDRDGRLDMFLANWWAESPSLLLKNETPGGHWLQVTIDGGEKINRMGIGCRVNAYQAGKLGQQDAFLGGQEIAVGYGYTSGQEAVAHLGLGKHKAVDLQIVLPHGKGVVTRKDVAANQRLKIEL